MGLNDENFSTIRNQVLALDPLAPLDTIFNMFQQKENYKKVMIGKDHRFKIYDNLRSKRTSGAIEQALYKHYG